MSTMMLVHVVLTFLLDFLKDLCNGLAIETCFSLEVGKIPGKFVFLPLFH